MNVVIFDANNERSGPIYKAFKTLQRGDVVVQDYFNLIKYQGEFQAPNELTLLFAHSSNAIDPKYVAVFDELQRIAKKTIFFSGGGGYHTSMPEYSERIWRRVDAGQGYGFGLPTSKELEQLIEYCESNGDSIPLLLEEPKSTESLNKLAIFCQYFLILSSKSEPNSQELTGFLDDEIDWNGFQIHAPEKIKKFKDSSRSAYDFDSILDEVAEGFDLFGSVKSNWIASNSSVVALDVLERRMAELRKKNLSRTEFDALLNEIEGEVIACYYAVKGQRTP